VLPDNYNIPVFIYGTLWHKYIRKHLFHRDVPVYDAVLPDWKRVDTGNLYRTLVPHPGGSVAGEVIWLHSKELEHLDSWESRYVRRSVKLLGGLEVYTYLLISLGD
jgi:gamma-glutamylcyclotransferase (GGCT)/AIG2-like uncharacterized protein YtfP